MFSASFILYPSTKQKQNVKPVAEARDGIHPISCTHLSHSGWKQQAKLSDWEKAIWVPLKKRIIFSPSQTLLNLFLKKQTHKNKQTTNIFQYSTDLSCTLHPAPTHTSCVWKSALCSTLFFQPLLKSGVSSLYPISSVWWCWLNLTNLISSKDFHCLWCYRVRDNRSCPQGAYILKKSKTVTLEDNTANRRSGHVGPLKKTLELPACDCPAPSVPPMWLPAVTEALRMYISQHGSSWVPISYLKCVQWEQEMERLCFILFWLILIRVK